MGLDLDTAAPTGDGAPGTEIEITPAMVQAAMEAMWEYPLPDPLDRDIVEKMLRAALSQDRRTEGV